MKQLRLIFPILCLLGLGWVLIYRTSPPENQAVGLAEGEVKASKRLDEEDPRMRIYLVIGDLASAARSESSHKGEVIERCFQLNQSKVWESVVDDQLPEHEFAKKYLEKNKSHSLGLVVNTRVDTSINDWLDKKTPENREVRQRVKFATQSGKMSGVIWFLGEEESVEGYTDKLKTLVNEYRSHLVDLNLPFIISQVEDSTNLRRQIDLFSANSHLTGIVSNEGINDSNKKDLLGSRCAELAIQLDALHTKMTPRPPSDIKFIDPHVHAMSVTPLGLRFVAQWMDERNVERCIVSPLNHKGSRPQNEEEYQTMLQNFLPYKGKIERMCIIKAGEVKSADEALTILKREAADGAIAFGEHYGEGLMFDDPQNLMLYEACEKVGFPVMFHIDQNKNMVEPGMARVDRVLKMYPNCKLVAHAYWWRQLANGTCDRQLQEHPNLYADMSGHVVIDVLNRDRAYAREFLIRNQDKILWATDEGWWSFSSKDKQMNRHYTFLEELDLPDEVRRKIYRENSEKVYGLKKGE
jgi:hypothetical protein